jgi:hypothetical protein
MSPAPVNSLEQVSKVLQPTSNATTTEKISVLQAFAATLRGTFKLLFFFLFTSLLNYTFTNRKPLSGEIGRDFERDSFGIILLCIFYRRRSFNDCFVRVNWQDLVSFHL